MRLYRQAFMLFPCFKFKKSGRVPSVSHLQSVPVKVIQAISLPFQIITNLIYLDILRLKKAVNLPGSCGQRLKCRVIQPLSIMAECNDIQLKTGYSAMEIMSGFVRTMMISWSV